LPRPILQGRLLAKRERLQQQLVGVEALLTRLHVAQTRTQASLDALDATMALAHFRVEPASAGVVDAWAGKYGKRGGLVEHIERLLRQTAPAPLTATVIINLTAHHFGIGFPTPKDRRSFRKSISSALACLLARGLIEPLHDRREGSHGVWRWKEQTPTLDALRRRQSAKQEA
jgi:hypothetical protein